jgi:hypothetical protein
MLELPIASHLYFSLLKASLETKLHCPTAGEINRNMFFDNQQGNIQASSISFKLITNNGSGCDNNLPSS